MNYEALTKQYWSAQQQRVEQLRAKIEARPIVGDGRKIPADDSLAIGDGRRMSMAIMFIDICGFSNRRLETQQEQGLMLKVLNLFFTEMIRICEEYGGKVEKNTGDGLMVYFRDNDGNPPENGSKRAIACALTMLVANEFLLTPILKNSYVVPIQFRTSIDHGSVTIANIGAPRRYSSNAAIGATANIASKMLKRAGASEIVIGANTKSRLPDSWQFLYTTPCAEPSGWSYTSTGAEYKVYMFTGRWNKLV